MSDEWNDVVVIRRKKPVGKDKNSDKEINRALAMGAGITTKVKDVKNSNTKEVVDFRKLDENTEGGKHKKVTLSLGKTIMSARNAKKMSQKDLAQKINEKPNIINNYEQGKAIPNNQILMKIQKVLGVKLTGKNIGEPLK